MQIFAKKLLREIFRPVAKLIRKLSIRQQLFGIVIVFMVPFIIAVAGLINVGNKDIHDSQLELKGIEYERHLISLITSLADFRVVRLRKIYSHDVDNDYQQKLKVVGDAIANLSEVNQGLASHFAAINDKQYERFSSVIEESWNVIKNSNQLEPLAFNLIFKNIINLIGSIGDASCLILDPDLDSYYLIHASIVSIPNLISHQSEVIFDTYSRILSGKIYDKSEKNENSVLFRMIKEMDTNTVLKDINTVLVSDSNYYGVSSNLNSKLKQSFDEYQKRMVNYSTKLNEVISEKNFANINLDDFYKLNLDLYSFTNKFTNDVLDELEVLLKIRIASLEHARLVTLSLSSAAQFLGCLVFWLLASNIMNSIKRLHKSILVLEGGSNDIIVPYKDYDNEIGLIANALDKLCFANIERNLLQRSFAEKGDYLQSILDNAMDGIIVINSKGIITDFNKAAERMFGYNEEEVLGRNVSILMPENFAINHDKYIKNHTDAGESNVIGINREIEGQTKDGIVFPISIALSELKMKDDVFFISLIKNISVSKAMENELIKHRDHLQELVEIQTDGLIAAKEYAETANRYKSEFIANITHELRTPMHAILNYAKMAIKNEDPHDPERSKKYLTIIQNSGKRLLYILNGLLDMSKLEAGKLEFNFDINDFTILLEQSIVEMNSLFEEKHIKVIVNNECVNPKIYCDGIKIVQVLINLFSNAIKFSPENSTLTVDLKEGDFEEKPSLIFSLADEGTGIPEDELEMVFEKFMQSSVNKGMAGGTGLGLRICRQIINAHKGKIWVKNNVDKKGTTCNFTIPLNISGEAYVSI